MSLNLIPWWLSAIGGAALASLLLVGFYTIKIDGIRSDDALALQQAQIDAQHQHYAANAISEANGNDNQTKHDDVDGKLADSMRKPTKCLAMRPSCPASVSEQAPAAGLLVQDAGIDRRDLQQYGHDAQSAEIDRQGCEAFVDSIYKANSQ